MRDIDKVFRKEEDNSEELNKKNKRKTLIIVISCFLILLSIPIIISIRKKDSSNYYLNEIFADYIKIKDIDGLSFEVLSYWKENDILEKTTDTISFKDYKNNHFIAVLNNVEINCENNKTVTTDLRQKYNIEVSKFFGKKERDNVIKIIYDYAKYQEFEGKLTVIKNNEDTAILFSGYLGDDDYVNINDEKVKEKEEVTNVAIKSFIFSESILDTFKSTKMSIEKSDGQSKNKEENKEEPITEVTFEGIKKDTTTKEADDIFGKTNVVKDLVNINLPSNYYESEEDTEKNVLYLDENEKVYVQINVRDTYNTEKQTEAFITENEGIYTSHEYTNSLVRVNGVVYRLLRYTRYLGGEECYFIRSNGVNDLRICLHFPNTLKKKDFNHLVIETLSGISFKNETGAEVLDNQEEINTEEATTEMSIEEQTEQTTEEVLENVSNTQEEIIDIVEIPDEEIVVTSPDYDGSLEPVVEQTENLEEPTTEMSTEDLQYQSYLNDLDRINAENDEYLGIN